MWAPTLLCGLALATAGCATGGGAGAAGGGDEGAAEAAPSVVGAVLSERCEAGDGWACVTMGDTAGAAAQAALATVAEAPPVALPEARDAVKAAREGCAGAGAGCETLVAWGVRARDGRGMPRDAALAAEALRAACEGQPMQTQCDDCGVPRAPVTAWIVSVEEPACVEPDAEGDAGDATPCSCRCTLYEAGDAGACALLFALEAGGREGRGLPRESWLHHACEELGACGPLQAGARAACLGGDEAACAGWTERAERAARMGPTGALAAPAPGWGDARVAGMCARGCAAGGLDGCRCLVSHCAGGPERAGSQGRARSDGEAACGARERRTLPAAVAALAQEARRQLDQGDAWNALAQLQEAKRAGATDGDLAALVAEAALALGDGFLAEEMARAALAAENEAPAARRAALEVLRGDALVLIADTLSAREAYERAQELAPSAATRAKLDALPPD